jgi:hypothetical protein
MHYGVYDYTVEDAMAAYRVILAKAVELMLTICTSLGSIRIGSLAYTSGASFTFLHIYDNS